MEYKLFGKVIMYILLHVQVAISHVKCECKDVKTKIIGVIFDEQVIFKDFETFWVCIKGDLPNNPIVYENEKGFVSNLAKNQLFARKH